MDRNQEQEQDNNQNQDNNNNNNNNQGNEDNLASGEGDVEPPTTTMIGDGSWPAQGQGLGLVPSSSPISPDEPHPLNSGGGMSSGGGNGGGGGIPLDADAVECVICLTDPRVGGGHWRHPNYPPLSISHYHSLPLTILSHHTRHQHTTSTHAINTCHQHMPSTHAINTRHQHTLSLTIPVSPSNPPSPPYQPLCQPS